MISQKVIDKDESHDLKEFIRETMVQLDQIRALGPLYVHEMWTYEYFMSILNRYVLNRAYPNGSMIKGYSNKEIIECCLG
jgi:hypothetical protein